MDVTSASALWSIGAGGLALLFALYLYSRMRSSEPGTPKMVELGEAIHEGAMAFLKREYRSLVIFVVVLAAVIWAVGSLTSPETMQPETAIAFVSGAIASALAGFVGMKSATSANDAHRQCRPKGRGAGLTIAFAGGAVMGMTVVGLGLTGVALMVLFFADISDVISFNIVTGLAWEPVRSPSLPAWAEGFTPKPRTSALTWSGKWKRASPKMIPEILP